MKRIILSILSIFLLCQLWAQSDFRSGYIITNEQDTVYGLIDYRGDIRNAKICSFKKTKDDTTINYYPSDIFAYRFTDSKYYISKNISSDDDPKIVFLEYLVDGIAKLYSFRDDRLNKHYYIEKEGQLHELIRTQKEDKIDGRTVIVTQNPFINVLRSTLNVQEMKGEIDRAKLENSSLINIVRNYHNYVCTDGSECIIYEKIKPGKTFRIAPVIGADISNVRIMEKFDEKYKFNSSKNLTVGVNMNFMIPQIDEKIFLQIEALYTKYYNFSLYETQQSSTDIHFLSNVLGIAN